MSGIFEHLAATDNTARVAARQAVAVAHKRVSDRVDSFIKSATSIMDFNSRVSLVDDDVRRIVSEVVAEYGADAETIYNSITAGWEDLTRGPDGKWSTPSSDDSSESEDSDIDSELADAPSAVGEGTLSRMAGNPFGDPSNPANAEAAGNLDAKNQFKDEQRFRGEQAQNPVFEVTPSQPEHADALANCATSHP